MLIDRLSTTVGQAVVCMPVTQRARVRSLIGTSFLGEVFFWDFSSPVREMSGSFRPQGPRISFGHHYHHHSSFITGANDLRCWCALKPQLYIHTIDRLSLLYKYNCMHWSQIYSIIIRLPFFIRFFPSNFGGLSYIHVRSYNWVYKHENTIWGLRL